MKLINRSPSMQHEQHLLWVQWIVCDIVFGFVRMNFHGTQIMRSTTAIHSVFRTWNRYKQKKMSNDGRFEALEELTQIGICCRYIARATPFCTRHNATEHGKWIIIGIPWTLGRYSFDSVARCYTTSIDASSILSIDNITLLHQVEHFFEFYLQRPVDVRQLFQ